MGENRKQVNAILRRKRAKRAVLESLARDADDEAMPSYQDPPFACPPDEEAKQ